MKKYVAGLMFSEDGNYVALIVKNKPDWQKGCLNGIGGKIEEKDFSMYYRGNKNIVQSKVAMIREFKEETGIKTLTKDWYLFLNMNGNNTDENKTPFSVDFYRCFSDKVFNCKTMEDEEVKVMLISEALCSKTIDNLKWIILLALDKNPKFTQTTY